LRELSIPTFLKKFLSKKYFLDYILVDCLLSTKYCVLSMAYYAIYKSW